jgi:hypothetical protein
LFFIRGHTKNACDRMFNIMKKKYHKSDTFTFSQMKERLVVEGQVEIVDATREHFHIWGKALNTFYKKFPRGHIFTNHIFSCNSSAPTTLRIKEWRDAPTEKKKSFVKRGTAGSDCSELMKQYELEQLMEPGLQEIKQVELWVKWRKFIPPQFRDEICPRPNEKIIARIKKEKNDKLKVKKLAKKKKIDQPPAVATESELVLESIEQPLTVATESDELVLESV